MNPILAILGVKWAKMAPFGGLEGSKMSFLGPKPTQDPMNNVFEQKNLRGKNISGPSGPPTEIIFGPGPGPALAGPAGGPKVVKIVPLGSLTFLKPHGTWEKWGRPARNSSSSQSYDQNTFSEPAGPMTM